MEKFLVGEFLGILCSKTHSSNKEVKEKTVSAAIGHDIWELFLVNHQWFWGQVGLNWNSLMEVSLWIWNSQYRIFWVLVYLTMGLILALIGNRQSAGLSRWRRLNNALRVTLFDPAIFIMAVPIGVTAIIVVMYYAVWLVFAVLVLVAAFYAYIFDWLSFGWHQIFH